MRDFAGAGREYLQRVQSTAQPALMPWRGTTRARVPLGQNSYIFPHGAFGPNVERWSTAASQCAISLTFAQKVRGPRVATYVRT